MAPLGLGIALLLACAAKTSAWPTSHDRRADAKPAAFILTGDSTTAKVNGWGDGFISDAVQPPAVGDNLGHNGATTVSFRAMGDWATAVSAVAHNKTSYDVYVTIQFGHNDQKETANITIGAYAANLGAMAADVKAAGGTPILVTPLTRRSFSGNPKRVTESLASERNATIAAALKTGTWFVDLNRASEDYVNALGPDEADRYNFKEGDRTHLNARGSVVFGRIVADLLAAKYPELVTSIRADANLTALISAGKPA